MPAQPGVKAAMNSNFLLLLQITDPYFPIGAYTQSFGLETYVQKGLVRDGETARQYLTGKLENSFLYNELLGMRLAYEYAAKRELGLILELNELYGASTVPAELKKAGMNLGRGFFRMAETYGGRMDLLRACQEAENVNYCLAFGIFCAENGIPFPEAALAFTYSQASAMINNLAKLLPLSQTEGQAILFQTGDLISRLAREVTALTAGDLGRSTIGFEIRSMQHERLYTRMYSS
ncbi:Urease accessory protein ureF [Syntrophobotulus glycolicus DSM 8271]|uniref:Urease accessory protein UreF n=1 Tax=Syntrophobotulus glycolicus (strain DSM 8271 / FlGlyR) TaxID=645991 RepID=F0T2K1_SYNGF|nr:urease accessory protein UreF [Syntrophobotulus glycolicus]ADY55319.1 Urease accessory protein ureF [Syntrophobotulus glycolicus DSM 8271]